MQRFLAVFLLLFLLSTSVHAAQGCIDAARTRIYTTQPTNNKYWYTSPFSTAPGGCFYVYTGAGCKIGNVGANNGFLGDTTNLVCPIDDYIGVMVALMAGLGFYIIRQKNMSLAVIS